MEQFDRKILAESSQELTMELLDRYLHAVEFWLPKRQRHDIIAELSEDLRSQIEDKEATLGRKLDDAEVETILKRCGSPLMVALRFRPQQYLIGPTLFPVYCFVLTILLLGCIVPRTIIWLVFLLVDPARAGYLHMENMLSTLVFFAFFTTVAFAILEKTGALSGTLNTWNPRKLPAVREPKRIPRSSSLFEIAALVVMTLWFTSIFKPTTVFNFFGAQITVASAWKAIFWGFLLSTAGGIAIAVANLFRPYWTPLRATLRLIVDVLGAAVFCWFLKAQILIAITAPSLPAARATKLTSVINLLLLRTLPWAVVVMLIIAACDVYRIVRLRSPKPSAGPQINDLSHSIVNGR
ncbi:MAG: hypothetical protein ABSD53_22265 [Terriglobales bacterium]